VSDFSAAENSPDIPDGTRQARRRKAVVIGAVTSIFVVAVATKFAPSPRTDLVPIVQAEIGTPVPEIELPSLSTNQLVRLSEFRGRAIVLNFWASWCTTCAEEAATLGDAERKWRSQDVIFLGINSSDSLDEARKFIQRYNIEFDSLVDRQGTYAAQWGVAGYPVTFFIDSQGNLVSTYASVIDRATLDARIAEIRAQ
jgi:peroxiredoxin